MKTLIVEDDFNVRHFFQLVLSLYGECDVAVDGKEAIEAFKTAHNEKKPYDLVCLDIMMPNMDGREALLEIRAIEDEIGLAGLEKVKIIMTTALNDPRNIIGSFMDQCEGYLIKPIDKHELVKKVRELKLIN